MSLRVLMMADTPADPNRGAAGTEMQTAQALRALGHDVRTIWSDELGRRIAHGNLHLLLELPRNPLRDYFNAHEEGRGIWKWDHYFDLYHRHLARFVDTDAHLVEVGVFSGGSLEMWRSYLGPAARITGIDIAPECRAYEDDHTKIAIGDQADRSFWAEFRMGNPPIDIVIDDGGHQPEQQRITLEETLPFLRPGGVFICEDIHGVGGHFAAYAHGLADRLNHSSIRPESRVRIVSPASALQAAVGSIAFYPFAVVIERNATPRTELFAERHGTEWQPFL